MSRSRPPPKSAPPQTSKPRTRTPTARMPATAASAPAVAPALAVETTAKWLAKRGIVPKVVVVLGSGFGDIALRLSRPAATASEPIVLAQADVPGWPAPAVAGHSGKLIAWPSGLCVLAGRVHAYEGRPAEEVVRAVRTLVCAGAKRVILTNASGGIDKTHRPGELVIISDHINLTGLSPLVGPSHALLGPRFPDMSAVYSPRLAERMQAAAIKLGGVPLRQAVYAGMLGPSYETPAEIRMLAAMGAGIVGMSTVLEAMACHAMGAEVLGLSCVAKLASGVSATPLSHEEVLAAVRRATDEVARLLEEFLYELV